MTSHSAPIGTPILNKIPWPRDRTGMQENLVFLYEPNGCIDLHGDDEGHICATALNLLFQRLQWKR